VLKCTKSTLRNTTYILQKHWQYFTNFFKLYLKIYSNFSDPAFHSSWGNLRCVISTRCVYKQNGRREVRAHPELPERWQQHEQRWNYLDIFQHLSHFVIRKGSQKTNTYINTVVKFLWRFRVKSQSFRGLKDVFQIRKWKGEFLLPLHCTQYLTLTIQRNSNRWLKKCLLHISL
jgi:hypothetical protein